jgi:hypothetical protein
MLEETIKDLLEDISEYYKENDWLVIKKFLLRYSHPSIRKNFSTRHEKTKKHTLNKYELEIINYYNTKHGVRLVLNEKDKHTENFKN